MTTPDLLIILARVVVGAIALVAGISKLRRLPLASSSLAGLFDVSVVWGRSIAVTLSLVEIAIGSLLLPGVLLSVAFLSAMVLFMGLSSGVLFLMLRGKSGKSCGCGGKNSQISAALVAHDAGVAALSAAGWLTVDGGSFPMLLDGSFHLFLGFGGVILTIVPWWLGFVRPRGGRISRLVKTVHD